MPRQQLLALFMCSFVVWAVGNGLLPLLPIYAAQLAAPLSLTGYYLAFAFFALALGTLTAGWLSDRLQRRKALLLTLGLLNIPALWLMGQVTSFWQLILMNALVFFMGGAAVTLLSILAGLFADNRERGRVFGVLGVASPLASISGGLAAGAIVDRWDFMALFTFMACLWGFLLIGSFLLEDKQVVDSGKPVQLRRCLQLSSGFFLLLLVNTLAWVGLYSSRIGITFSMDALHYSATAISSTTVVSGLVTLPLPLLLGWLSDRTGRWPLLMASYLAGALGLLTLAFAVPLWQFWLATSLLAILSVGAPLGSAMVTDIVPKAALGRALALFSNTPWLAGIIGFAAAGSIIQSSGITATFLWGALLPLTAALLLSLLRSSTSPINTMAIDKAQ